MKETSVSNNKKNSNYYRKVFRLLIAADFIVTLFFSLADYKSYADYRKLFPQGEMTLAGWLCEISASWLITALIAGAVVTGAAVIRIAAIRRGRVKETERLYRWGARLSLLLIGAYLLLWAVMRFF